MDGLKEILFGLLGIVGVIALILGLILGIITFIIWITKAKKIIIQGIIYSKNKHIYENKNNIILSSSGNIVTGICDYTLDEEIEIYQKAIDRCNRYKNLEKKLSKIK